MSSLYIFIEYNATFHDPFMPSKLITCGNLLHIMKFSHQFEIQPWLPMGTKEMLTIRFCLSNSGLLFLMADFSVPAASISCPSKEKLLHP